MIEGNDRLGESVTLPEPSVVERPLTLAMHRVLRANLSRRVLRLLAVAAGLTLVFFLFMFIFTPTVGDALWITLRVGGIVFAFFVFLSLWSIGLFVRAMSRGTYVRTAGPITTRRRQAWDLLGPYRAGYLVRVGEREVDVERAVYEAAGRMTAGTMVYAGPYDVIELCNVEGRVRYRHPRYTPVGEVLEG